MGLERKNIEVLSPQELAAYEHAIQIMRDRSQPDNNYTYHANLHNEFGVDPPHGCEHANDLFFPWHRYHLYNFERELQRTDPDHPTMSTRNVTIPFWNWSRGPQSGIRYPAAFERKQSILFDELRATDPSEPMFDVDYLTQIVRSNADWNAFAGGPKDVNEYFGAFEDPSHNDMHSIFIQGNMGKTWSAAEDPIYWSFHCFIDRLWARWQKIHGKEPTCMDCGLRGFRDAPTVRHVVNVEDLGYFYSFTPDEIAPITSPPTLGPAVLSVATPAGADGIALQTGEIAFSYRLKLPRERFTTAAIWLTGVHMPITLSYQLDILLYPDGVTFNPQNEEWRRQYMAGHFSFWEAHRSPAGEPHRHRVGAFVPVGVMLQPLVEQYPGGEANVALVARAVLVAQHRGRVLPVRPLSEEVRFQTVVLALNGATPEPAGHVHGRCHDLGDRGHGR